MWSDLPLLTTLQDLIGNQPSIKPLNWPLCRKKHPQQRLDRPQRRTPTHDLYGCTGVTPWSLLALTFIRSYLQKRPSLIKLQEVLDRQEVVIDPRDLSVTRRAGRT